MGSQNSSSYVDITALEKDTPLLDTVMDASKSSSSALETTVKLFDSLLVSINIRLVHALLLALDSDFHSATVLHAPMWMKPSVLSQSTDSLAGQPSAQSGSTESTVSGDTMDVDKEDADGPEEEEKKEKQSDARTNSVSDAARMVILPLQLFYHNNVYMFNATHDSSSVMSLIVNLESVQHIKLTVQALSSDIPVTQVIQHPLVASRDSQTGSDTQQSQNNGNGNGSGNGKANDAQSSSSSKSRQNQNSSSETGGNTDATNLMQFANQINSMNPMANMTNMNMLNLLFNHQQQQQAAAQQAAMLMAAAQAQSQFNNLASLNKNVANPQQHPFANSSVNSNAANASSKKQRKRAPRVCNKTVKLSLSTSSPDDTAAVLVSIGSSRNMMMVASIQSTTESSKKTVSSETSSSTSSSSTSESHSETSTDRGNTTTTTTTTTTSTSNTSSNTLSTQVTESDSITNAITQVPSGIVMFATISPTERLRLHFFSPDTELPQHQDAQVPYVTAKLHEIDKLARCKVLVDFVEMAQVRVKLSKDKPLVNLVVELRNQINETVERVRQRLYFKSQGNFEHISRLSQLPTTELSSGAKLDSVDTEDENDDDSDDNDDEEDEEMGVNNPQSASSNTGSSNIEESVASAMAKVNRNKRKQPESVPNSNNYSDDSQESIHNKDSQQSAGKQAIRTSRRSKRQRV